MLAIYLHNDFHSNLLKKFLYFLCLFQEDRCGCVEVVIIPSFLIVEGVAVATVFLSNVEALVAREATLKAGYSLYVFNGIDPVCFHFFCSAIPFIKISIIGCGFLRFLSRIWLYESMRIQQ